MRNALARRATGVMRLHEKWRGRGACSTPWRTIPQVPLTYFSNEAGTAAELDAAVVSLADATSTAETELVELAQVVLDACEAVDEMCRPAQMG